MNSMNINTRQRTTVSPSGSTVLSPDTNAMFGHTKRKPAIITPTTNRQAIELNNRGVDAFQNGDVTNAVLMFSQALRHAKHMDGNHDAATAAARSSSPPQNNPFRYQWVSCPSECRQKLPSAMLDIPINQLVGNMNAPNVSSSSNNHHMTHDDRSSSSARGVGPRSWVTPTTTTIVSPETTGNNKRHRSAHNNHGEQQNKTTAGKSEKNLLPGAQEEQSQDIMGPAASKRQRLDQHWPTGAARMIGESVAAATVGGAETETNPDCSPVSTSATHQHHSTGRRESASSSSSSSSSSPMASFLVIRALKIMVASSSSQEDHGSSNSSTTTTSPSSSVEGYCPCKFAWAIWMNLSLAFAAVGLQHNNGTTEAKRRYFLLKSANILTCMDQRIRKDPKPRAQEWHILLLVISNTLLCISRELAMSQYGVKLWRQIVELLTRARTVCEPKTLRAFLLNAKVLSHVPAASVA